MTWSYSSTLLDTVVSPGISSFREAKIPDLVELFPEAEHWLANHFLNTILRGKFPAGVRQVALGYLRRTHESFVAYHEARKLTYEYLAENDPHNPSLRKYYAAIATWEVFALQTSMALDLFKWLNEGQGAFKKNDGSREQRLYTIANQVKHTSSCVDSGQCTVHDTVPLWLTDNGVHSYGVSVSYLETSDVLAEIARLADNLQDPRSFVEKRVASGAQTFATGSAEMED